MVVKDGSISSSTPLKSGRGVGAPEFRRLALEVAPASEAGFTTEVPFLPWHVTLDMVLKMSLVSVDF